ncbi:SRPBCC family protein [Cribrihabitans neustonicus]|uniref:SRPBCC family protein n=1 Tax=Cribrihabitans neustonicus TaxID=1429085 RepID=UPI003B5CBD90
MTLDPETDLSFTRQLGADPAQLWTCWTTPLHLRAFFIPAPHAITACEIDLRPGGRFNTTFDVEGREIRNKGVFLEVEEERKLVFTDAYSEGWKPAPDPFMTAIVLFEPAVARGTSLTIIARHRSAEARERHEQMGFQAGWGVVADQLDAHAKTLP